MKHYKLKQRIKDAKYKNKIIGYNLIDENNNMISVTSDQLKQAMRAGQVKVNGLKLTRDERLIVAYEEVEETAFSKNSNFDLNAAIQSVFDVGCLNSQQIIDNFYSPIGDSNIDKKEQARYDKYLSDMKEAIISIMHKILHCNIGGDTVNATYALVVKKNIADEDHVRYIQGEKAALTAYANAIVQLVKNINKEYNDAVEYAYEVGDPEDDTYYALENAGDRLDNMQDCIKIYIKH